jgi:hypothetical protein
MLDLPALHIQVSAHGLVEQEGAITSLHLGEFVEGGNLFHFKPKRDGLLIGGSVVYDQIIWYIMP